MKKIVLTFGLIAGVVMSLMMVVTIPFADSMGQGAGMLLGYTGMVLASLMIYFGVRQYRDNEGRGQVSFGQAFKVAMGISAIAVACYVLTWEVVYRNFHSDFGEKYAQTQLEREKAKGASEEELAKKSAEFEEFWAKYKANMLFRWGLTTLEPLPVVLLFSLVSAGLLRRKAASA
ncbi:MAG: DUF4199 domain-containing protein [Gemmatimonadaceae bacterium]|nr:DUF4199 domain-containing protein [Gemmatimonadaceae bacterium]